MTDVQSGPTAAPDTAAAVSRLTLCSMAVPWPDRRLLGSFHLDQARALAEFGCAMTLFGPAPAIPGWLSWTGFARSHAKRPARYQIDGVAIESPRVRFGFPGIVRQKLAPKAPETWMGLCARTVRRSLLEHCERTGTEGLVGHGIMPWGRLLLEVGAELDVPVGFLEHSASDVMRLRPGTRLADSYLRCADAADFVFVVGPQMRRHAVELGWPRVEFLMNGIAPQPPAREPDPEWRGGRHLLAAANYYPRKGLHEVVAAFDRVAADVDDVTLHVVTGAPPDLRQQIDGCRHRDRIALHDPLPAVELRQRMAWSDLYVLPSWAEAFGLVFGEALLAGTPIVASNDCGFVEALGWQTGRNAGGWVVEPRDVDALAAAMREALLLPDLAAIGQAGRELARPFTWQANAQQLLNRFRAADSRGRSRFA